MSGLEPWIDVIAIMNLAGGQICKIFHVTIDRVVVEVHFTVMSLRPWRWLRESPRLRTQSLRDYHLDFQNFFTVGGIKERPQVTRKGRKEMVMGDDEI